MASEGTKDRSTNERKPKRSNELFAYKMKVGVAHVQVYKESQSTKQNIQIPGRQLESGYCWFFYNFPNN